MNLVLVISLHFLIYALPVFLSTLFSKEFQVYFNYTYLGVMFCLTQLFDTLYYIELTDQFFLMGGDIAYCAMMFTAIFLVISQPQPKVVRNLIYYIAILNIFLSILFVFLNFLFVSTSSIISIDLYEVLTEFSFRSLFLSVLLFSSEILLFLLTLKAILPRIKKQPITIVIAVTYTTTLLIDGVLYPAGINLLFPESNSSIRISILAKIIFGGGFGFLLLLYLNLFPYKLTSFTANRVSIIRYILPPKRKKLLQKYEDA
ncbi:MAG: hypothetical protein ACTSRK_01175, partial [Promethearchaeota archaeon]